MSGQILTFHLAGINNQNFLMRDDETGSYWQQITGKAVAGPLRGNTLPMMRSDELSFRVWQAEQPLGRVLAPVAQYAHQYEPKDWDRKMAKARVVLHFPHSGLAERTEVFGIEDGGAARAFPVMPVISEKLVMDRVSGSPVLLVTASDNASVRAFHNLFPPRDFYRQNDGVLLDAQTGSRWNFAGCAVSGPDKGRCLEPLRMIKDYWFDWKNYHPATTIYSK